MKTTTANNEVLFSCSSDDAFRTEAELKALGYTYSDCCDWLELPGTNDYAEQVSKWKVYYSAVDGFRGSKTFSSRSAARAFRDSSFPEGGVSTDGVQRYDGMAYKLRDSKTWFPVSR